MKAALLVLIFPSRPPGSCRLAEAEHLRDCSARCEFGALAGPGAAQAATLAGEEWRISVAISLAAGVKCLAALPGRARTLPVQPRWSEAAYTESYQTAINLLRASAASTRLDGRVRRKTVLAELLGAPRCRLPANPYC